jgi:hypothetical protein
MNKRNSNRSFADCGRHSLDVAAAHVANRKDAGAARFEQIWRPCQRPLRVREIVRQEIRACFHEALFVKDDAAVQPFAYWESRRS